jgi:uncharacterized protein (TIGR02271 family)
MSPVTEYPTVISAEGVYGRVESEGPETHDGNLEVLVSFDNGERLWVPADRLILQEDGNYQLNMSLQELSVQLTRPTLAARPADLDAMLKASPVETTQKMPVLTADLQPAVPPPSPAAAPSTPAELDDDLEAPDFPTAAADLPEAPDAGLDHVQLSRVVESVREDVGASLLREEVEIHRVPVNQYVDEAPPIRYEDDRIIIPVLEEVLQVEKRLLVKEEVVVTKRRSQAAAEQRELRQTTQVVAAPASADAPGFDEARYRRHYEAQRHPGAHGFAYYEPAYRFGDALRRAARYQGWTWARVEPEARALWERDNPGTWATLAPAVRYAWTTPDGA